MKVAFHREHGGDGVFVPLAISVSSAAIGISRTLPGGVCGVDPFGRRFTRLQLAPQRKPTALQDDYGQRMETPAWGDKDGPGTDPLPE